MCAISHCIFDFTLKVHLNLDIIRSVQLQSRRLPWRLLICIICWINCEMRSKEQVSWPWSKKILRNLYYPNDSSFKYAQNQFVQLAELTHHQRLCEHPSHMREKCRKPQEDDVMTDRDLPGPQPHICTLRGTREKSLTKWMFKKQNQFLQCIEAKDPLKYVSICLKDSGSNIIIR